MKRAYLTLSGIALVAAFTLSLLGRHAPHAAAPSPPAPDPPLTSIAIEVNADHVAPEFLAVPKEHQVRLRVTSRSAVTLSIRLAGYEDRVTVRDLGPGESREIEFLADRPGGDFTWLVNGRPIGRLAVTGSHLVGDHR